MSSPSLDYFNQKLAQYIEASGKDADEILGKKGRDLGIRLFRGYTDHRFGGPGKAPKNLARSQLDARRARGQGIKVRASLLTAYQEKRAQLIKKQRSLGQRRRFHGGTLGQWEKLVAKSDHNRRLRSDLWRRTVGLELGRRQSGIGALAASFLWVRKRSSQAGGTTLVPNRTGRPIGTVQRGPGFLRITAQSPGISTVDQRYHIVDAAVLASAEDMMTYLRRKTQENARQLTS